MYTISDIGDYFMKAMHVATQFHTKNSSTIDKQPMHYSLFQHM